MPDMTDIKEPGGTTPPGLLSYSTLKNRPDFLRAARGRRVHSDAFVLQGWHRGDDLPPRVGYTCSKKVGNAVARNRAKRRLRAAALSAIPKDAQMGWDYVLIGRAGKTADIPFESMVKDLTVALAKVHRR